MAENKKDIEDIKKGIGDVNMPPGMDVPSPDIPSPDNSEEETPYMPSYTSSETKVEIPPIGQPSMPQALTPQVNMGDRIHEIAEAVIEEKWNEFTRKIGDLNVWKEKVSMNISAVKQEVIRIQDRFENLQKSVIGRVSEYDQGMRVIHTEMKALEKVFERILEPLVSNVKELSKITEELKKIKK